MTLQEKLKTQTTDLHNELEQLMFVNHIMQKSLTLMQYKKLLACNYLVHHQYEEVIHSKLAEKTAVELAITKRKKLDSLTKDVKDAGVNTDRLHELSLMPVDFNNEPFAIGAMYVLEGATLGGSVIVKQLRLNANFSEHFNFNYYNIYRKELIQMWQQFLVQLNTLPKEQHHHVLNGAKTMFNAIITTAKMSKAIEFE